jgi:hypothetical protein
MASCWGFGYTIMLQKELVGKDTGVVQNFCT